MLARGSLTVGIRKQLLKIRGLLAQLVTKARWLSESQRKTASFMVVHVTQIVSSFLGIVLLAGIARRMAIS